jgi:hypothetical protein
VIIPDAAGKLTEIREVSFTVGFIGITVADFFSAH